MNKRLWKILWLRYRPIILVLGVLTLVVTVVGIMQSLPYHDVLTKAQFLAKYGKSGNYDSYQDFVEVETAYYLKTTGMFPYSNGGVIVSIFMLGVAGLFGALLTNIELQNGFDTFCQRAGFTTNQVYGARTLLFSGVLVGLVTLNVLAQVVAYFIRVPAKYVGITPSQVGLLVVLNIVWILVLYLGGQAIGTIFGHNWFALLLAIILVVFLVYGIFGTPIIATPAGFGFIIDPGTEYWLVFGLGVGGLVLTGGLGFLMNRFADRTRLRSVFTVPGTNVLAFIAWAICWWLSFDVTYNEKYTVVNRPFKQDLVIIAIAAVVWFGGQWLVERRNRAK